MYSVGLIILTNAFLLLGFALTYVFIYSNRHILTTFLFSRKNPNNITDAPTATAEPK
jgi:hypothetical protein